MVIKKETLQEVGRKCGTGTVNEIETVKEIRTEERKKEIVIEIRIVTAITEIVIVIGVRKGRGRGPGIGMMMIITEVVILIGVLIGLVLLNFLFN